MSPKEEEKINTVENESNSIGNPSVYNTLCLEYMSFMGYGEVCEQFSKETNSTISHSPVLERRCSLRKLIDRGEIDEVFSAINDINIELIDNNPLLYYTLVQHKAYEKANDIHSLSKCDGDIKIEMMVEVLDYVKEELKEIVEKHPVLVPQLEDLLEYLIFNSSNISIKEKRSELADTVNRIILDKFDKGENELERIVEGILKEEDSLSKTNKFVDFKNLILK